MGKETVIMHLEQLKLDKGTGIKLFVKISCSVRVQLHFPLKIKKNMQVWKCYFFADITVAEYSILIAFSSPIFVPPLSSQTVAYYNA